MEDKIEVGEYVRTKDGIIAKLVDLICGQDACFDNEIICKSFDMTLSDFELNHIDIFSKAFREVIVKHSKNIIDLIEEGDIIIYFSNSLRIYIKCEVNYVCSKYNNYKIGDRYVSTVLDDLIRIEDIKSIVTKEQFETIKYKEE